MKALSDRSHIWLQHWLCAECFVFRHTIAHYWNLGLQWKGSLYFQCSTSLCWPCAHLSIREATRVNSVSTAIHLLSHRTRRRAQLAYASRRRTQLTDLVTAVFLLYAHTRRKIEIGLDSCVNKYCKIALFSTDAMKNSLYFDGKVLWGNLAMPFEIPTP